MARPLRLEYPGAVWHLTARGNERKRIFRSAPDYLRFLELLGEAARRYNWIVYAYVLMTNHTHLVIETPEETLSRGMQWLNGKYAQWFNRKYKRCGHLFQGRFKGFVVEKETYLLEVLRYVVLNPVRAEMVERPEKYRWSSYRATAGYEGAPAWLAVAPVHSLFAPEREAAQRLYRTFVDDRLTDPRSPFENLVAQLFLGSEGWIERMRERIESRPRSDAHPAAQRYAARPKMAKIVAEVARDYGVSESTVRHGHGGEARQLAAWLGCFEGMQKRAAIAAGLRIGSSGHASDLIRLCDARLDRDLKLQQRVDRCCDRLRGSPPPGRFPIHRASTDN
jgi:REP element-mobilizing transposase RayT